MPDRIFEEPQVLSLIEVKIEAFGLVGTNVKVPPAGLCRTFWCW